VKSLALSKEKESSFFSYTVSFNWDIHWVCNYDCPYCWFHGQWESLRSKNRYPEKDRIIAAWERVYARNGRVKVSITGGEPFLFPHFTDIIQAISRMHSVEIITNLSVDVTDFLDRVNRKNVVINPSFHALSADADTFIRKILALREAEMVQCITFLAYPPLIGRLPALQEKFSASDLSLTIQSFFGTMGDLRYPEGYTQEEKAAIFPQLGTRGGQPFQTEAFSPKNKLCNAGKNYGVIQPDGTVRRCGGQSDDAVVGNLFDDDFKMRSHPSPCTSERCPCNEWAFLLYENGSGHG